MPTTSRTCQNRPRSRYSHPWAPNTGCASPRSKPVVAGSLARQAADDDDHQRAEQQVGQQPLAARLAAGDQRREEDAGGQVGGGHEEDRQLQVPGRRQVVGQQLRQVDAEEAAGLDVVMDGRPAEQGLHQEEGGDDEEVPGRRALGRRQRHLRRRHEPQPALLGLVPAHRSE